jgi:penicillin-binding protein 1C
MGWNEYSYPVAVKTGTSSNYRDAWTVAFSSRYLVGVWVGHPDYRPMSRISGYRAAAKLVRQVMNHLHHDQRDGLEDLGFPPPRGARPVRLCTLTGKRATEACDRVSLEWFTAGQEPVSSCDAHHRVAVDTRNGLLASSRTPPRFLEVRTFVQLPPVYAAWAARGGFARPPEGVSPLSAKVRDRSNGPAPLTFGRPVNIEITSPEDGLRLLRDPETPAGMATLALQAAVDPPTGQVLWYVDGAPFQLVDYPYTARWPLEPGEHTIQAQLPHTDVASRPVRVVVQ